MYIAHNKLDVQNEEQRRMLEERFAMAGEHMKQVPGFEGFQMLRSTDNSHFLVSTTWTSEQHFQDWVTSPHFAAAHNGSNRGAAQAQVATYEVVYTS